MLTADECTSAAIFLGMRRSSNGCYNGHPYCYIHSGLDTDFQSVVLHTCHSTDVGFHPGCPRDCGSISSTVANKAVCMRMEGRKLNITIIS